MKEKQSHLPPYARIVNPLLLTKYFSLSLIFKRFERNLNQTLMETISWFPTEKVTFVAFFKFELLLSYASL